MSHNKKIAIWLFICAFMVAMMVLVGGLTRLTESGLSITEWEPIKGALPPLTEADWENLLNEYRGSPEYLHKNQGMNIEEFKNIFWLEYIHRLLGRMVGLVFFLPFAYFLIKKQLEQKLSLKLAGIFLLGGLQGLVGWYMVKSGLIDVPSVSHFRLMFHLILAFIIFSLLFTTALNLLSPNGKQDFPLKRFSAIVILLIFLQSAFGAMVAGLDAGMIYNTFPLMNGRIIPEDILAYSPVYENLHNHATIQFLHRIFAFISLFTILWFSVKCIKLQDKKIALSANILIILIALQFMLGILTLLHQVPIGYASKHQMGALILVAWLFWIRHLLKRESHEKIKTANH